MLQSVNDLIDSVQYAEDAPLMAMVPSAIVSYFTQFIPTIGGQIERAAEEKRMDNGGRNSYDDGNSYRKHYVRGHYSRENGRGYSRGGYSRDGGKDQMMDQLEDMLNDAGSEKERQAIQRCISQLENA